MTSTGRLVFERPFSNGEAATRILGVVPAGQQTVNEYGFLAPRGVFFAGGRPFVVDTGDNRIVRFPAFTDWGDEATLYSPAADAVFGQSSFNANLADRGDPEASSYSYWAPSNAVVDGNEVYLADTGNNRVLDIPTTIGDAALSGAHDVAAVRVLGQTFFNLYAPNYVEGRELNGALGVAVDTSSTPRGYTSPTRTTTGCCALRTPAGFVRETGRALPLASPICCGWFRTGPAASRSRVRPPRWHSQSV